jgi:hypothetical protein
MEYCYHEESLNVDDNCFLRDDGDLVMAEGNVSVKCCAEILVHLTVMEAQLGMKITYLLYLERGEASRSLFGGGDRAARRSAGEVSRLLLIGDLSRSLRGDRAYLASRARVLVGR